MSEKRISHLIGFFHRYPTESLSVEDMTQISGLGLRNLYYSFKKYTGYSPQQYFKNIRLKYLHRDLKSSDVEITRLALNYNFNHHGDFSACYKKMFGELPSETLKAYQPSASGRI